MLNYEKHIMCGSVCVLYHLLLQKISRSTKISNIHKSREIRIVYPQGPSPNYSDQLGDTLVLSAPLHTPPHTWIILKEISGIICEYLIIYFCVVRALLENIIT